MSEMKKIVVSGKKVVESETLDISTTLPSNTYFLLRGIIYSPTNEPIADAAIEVYKIDESVIPNEKILIGVTFSIEDGSYGISLEMGLSYILVVYS